MRMDSLAQWFSFGQKSLYFFIRIINPFNSSFFQKFFFSFALISLL